MLGIVFGKAEVLLGLVFNMEKRLARTWHNLTVNNFDVTTTLRTAAFEPSSRCGGHRSQAVVLFWRCGNAEALTVLTKRFVMMRNAIADGVLGERRSYWSRHRLAGVFGLTSAACDAEYARRSLEPFTLSCDSRRGWCRCRWRGVGA
ncbi:hypothetical protein WI664_00205 [Vibrio cholerae]